MRIAYVCADRGVRPAGSGGSATHVREMVKALAARGLDIVVFATSGDAGSPLPFKVVDLQANPGSLELRSRIQRAARAHPDEARSSQEVYSLLLNQSLAAALESMSPAPDAVYERHSLWSVAGLDFARRRGIPHLLEVNAPLVEQQYAYRELELEAAAGAIEGYVLSGSDRVLATSPELVGYARSHGASGRNVRVVPCGVPGSMFSAPLRTRQLDPSRFVVGFVGSLKPWHGVDVLLRAFRKLRAIDRSYYLVIVGDGPQRADVERYIREHRLEGCSDVLGNVPHEEVVRTLSRMDVAVAPYPELPSFYFSPVKLWEYAAAGVPIAASSSGEISRLFPHGEAALLHPPGSASKLAGHIHRLRSDAALATRLSRRARRIARAHTWDRLAARVEKIALDAIRARRG
jgi:glycosyltransferase involved in cell wall biosynthesis